MSDSRQVTREEIEKITFGVSFASPEQRATVRSHLHALAERDGYVLYKAAFHKEMAQLEESNQISETELHALEHAFFG